MKRDYLSKRFSIPLWALLAILAVCIVTLTIPDEGSYYHKRELEEATPPPAFLEVEAPGEVESRLIGIDVSQYQGAWAGARSGISTRYGWRTTMPPLPPCPMAGRGGASGNTPIRAASPG